MESNKTNLIVNYLPQAMTDEEFYALFASVGEPRMCKVIRDRSTNYSFGYGFVEYATEAEAYEAIQSLNGLQIENKTLKVAYSRTGENGKGANLYIRNLPRNMSAEQLQQVFDQYGKIVQTRVLSDQMTGASKGIGFVLYDTRDMAEQAMAQMHGQTLPGSPAPLLVTFAEDKSQLKAQEAKMAIAQQMGGGGYGMGYAAAAPGYPPRGRGVGRGMRGAGAPGFRGGMSRGGYAARPRVPVPAVAARGGGPMRRGAMQRQRFNPMGNQSGNGYAAIPTVGTGSGYGAGKPVAATAAAADPTTGGHIIFAYNIGPYTGEDDLRELFAPYGTVLKVNVIVDHAKQMGKGYGFVTMATYEEGAYAIENLNGYNYAGKPLQVSFKSANSGQAQV